MRVALVGVTQQCVRLVVDGDRLFAGGGVDARQDAVVAIARILGLDARDVGDRVVCGAARAVRVGAGDVDLVLACHGAEAKAVTI